MDIEQFLIISNNLSMDNFKKLFGAKVKSLRKLNKLSQEKLAESVGLSTKTISYIENGKNCISFNKLPLLAKALQVPVYKLFVPEDFEEADKSLDSLLKSASQKEMNALATIVKTILDLR